MAEGCLKIDKFIPPLQLPTDKQIKSANYNKKKEAIMAFSIIDIRSYIADHYCTW